ncbi:MAG TPA: metal-dependent hydrolase [Dehalococcoidia bacterium]|nr:metal-dependent hydrolase [Dehalococcoidia bacterium]
MLFFAHTGITLGSALLVGNALSKGYSRRSAPQGRVVTGTSSPPQLDCATDCVDDNPPWFNSLAKQIDYRLILIGSLLPDIVDKPIGGLFFGNGRIFCHTLLFLVVLSSAAVYFYTKRGITWLIALSFGTFIHLILDQMWLEPGTLLWPIYGWAFERMDLSHWLEAILYALRTDPAVYISELVGFAILASFAVILARRKRVHAFIKMGAAQLF